MMFSRWLVFLIGIVFGVDAFAQADASAPSISLSLGGSQEVNVSTAIQIMLLMTVLTLSPSLMMLMTSFTRMVIVLGFIRNAIGLQGAPSNQIIIGMSLFLTFFVMAPTAKQLNEDALQPYLDKKITTVEAIEKASVPLRNFMVKQTRPSEIDFFLGLSGRGPTATISRCSSANGLFGFLQTIRRPTVALPRDALSDPSRSSRTRHKGFRMLAGLGGPSLGWRTTKRPAARPTLQVRRGCRGVHRPDARGTALGCWQVWPCCEGGLS